MRKLPHAREKLVTSRLAILTIRQFAVYIADDILIRHLSSTFRRQTFGSINLKPPSCRTNQLPSERASSSATLSWVASRWWCKSRLANLRDRSFFGVLLERTCILQEIDPDNSYSDILHPNRANISKEELREKLAALYKASKEQVNVFGLQTQFGGGKTTGFALVYDSPEALKKFEPHYRLVRVGLASKIEKASRQQRTFTPVLRHAAAADFDGPSRLGRMELTDLQASNARTDKRPSEVRRRSRVHRRRRRNRRIAPLVYVQAGGNGCSWFPDDHGHHVCMHCNGLLVKGCEGKTSSHEGVASIEFIGPIAFQSRCLLPSSWLLCGI